MTVEEDGIVHAYLLDGAGGGRKLSSAEVKAWKPEDGILWVHMNYTHARVRTWLQDESGLDALSCQALSAEDPRPRALGVGQALLVILRGANTNEGQDAEDMVSLRMWLEERRIITLRNRPVMAVRDIEGQLREGTGPKSSGQFLIEVVSRLLVRIGGLITELDDSVDALEETVLDGESRELRTQLAHARREAIALRRYLSPQRDVLSRLQAERTPVLTELDRGHIREAADRVTRYVEDLDSARDRAAVTQEELSSRLSDQMNRTMYLLSIVAAIFLPLGLLTGLLGINVGGIPGTDNDWAFTAVSVGLIILAVGLVSLFRRMRWL